MKVFEPGATESRLVVVAESGTPQRKRLQGEKCNMYLAIEEELYSWITDMCGCSLFVSSTMISVQARPPDMRDVWK